MKNNLLTSMFAGLLCLSTLSSCWLMYKYNTSVHRLQALQPRVMEVNKVMSIMQAILNDTIEYNRNTKNPDMNRLLQSFSAPQGPKPAAKLPTK